MLVEFDRRFDRFASRYKKNIRLEDKIAVLNEAQEKIFENRVSVAETNSEIRNDLRPFEIKDFKLKRKREADQYTVFELPSNFYHKLRIKCIASTKECGKKEIPVTFAQTDDLEQMLKDDFWKPSFLWENILGDEGSEGFYIYHENDVKIESVIVDYYRMPGKLHCADMSKTGSYRDYDDKLIKINTNCEFETLIWQSIVDLAVLIARADIGDDRDFEIQQKKYLIKDKIEK